MGRPGARRHSVDVEMRDHSSEESHGLYGARQGRAWAESRRYVSLRRGGLVQGFQDRDSLWPIIENPGESFSIAGGRSKRLCFESDLFHRGNSNEYLSAF